MTSDELRRAYQGFFLKTEAGKHYMTNIEEIINRQHVAAENEPTLARDYAQRAKGAREILDNIKSVCAERKTR